MLNTYYCIEILIKHFSGTEANRVMRKLFLIAVGWLSLAMAIAGMLLPVLPHTPFILLAAWCFARSSKRFSEWLLYRSLFGPDLQSWQKHRAIQVKTKPKMIIMAIISFSISIWIVSVGWLKIMLLCIFVILLYFIIRLPVVDELSENNSV